MTLVLALRCRDGIVMASDGQATCDAAGQPTREPVRKLFALGRHGAWGAAGSAGLCQTLSGELDATLLSGPAATARERIAERVIAVQQRAVRAWVPHPDAQPPELSCVLCWHDATGAHILGVPRTGSDHRFHDDYAAIGSGDIFAVYALRSTLHLDTPALSLEQAKMVAYDTIARSIDVAAVFLGPPIQMFVVRPDGASEVSRDELEGPLADAVDAWRARQRETLGELGPRAPARVLPLLGPAAGVRW